MKTLVSVFQYVGAIPQKHRIPSARPVVFAGILPIGCCLWVSSWHLPRSTVPGVSVTQDYTNGQIGEGSGFIPSHASPVLGLKSSKNFIVSWRDVFMGKTICCSLRGRLEFSSQHHPQQTATTTHKLQLQESSTLFWVGTGIMYTYLHTHTQIQIKSLKDLGLIWKMSSLKHWSLQYQFSQVVKLSGSSASPDHQLFLSLSGPVWR